MNFSTGVTSYSSTKFHYDFLSNVIDLRIYISAIPMAAYQTIYTFDNATFADDTFTFGLELCHEVFEDIKSEYETLLDLSSAILANSGFKQTQTEELIEQISQGDYCQHTGLTATDQISLCEDIVYEIESSGILVAISEIQTHYSGLVDNIELGSGSFSEKKQTLSKEVATDYLFLCYFVNLVLGTLEEAIVEETSSILMSRVYISCAAVGASLLIFLVYYIIGITKVLYSMSRDITKTQQILLLFSPEIISSNNYIKSYIKARFSA